MTPLAMKDLLEAGVHFGHQTKRWNPKMKPFIFGERSGIYILDLGKTVKHYREAEDFVRQLASEGKLGAGRALTTLVVIATLAAAYSAWTLYGAGASALAPSFRTTNALTRSPCASSGIPTTQASATAGCSSRTASTCAG